MSSSETGVSATLSDPAAVVEKRHRRVFKHEQFSGIVEFAWPSPLQSSVTRSRPMTPATRRWATRRWRCSEAPLRRETTLSRAENGSCVCRG